MRIAAEQVGFRTSTQQVELYREARRHDFSGKGEENTEDHSLSHCFSTGHTQFVIVHMGNLHMQRRRDGDDDL